MSGHGLHVFNGVYLIDNLHAQKRLHDIFEGDDTGESAVFVQKGRNRLLSLQELLQEAAQTQKVREHLDLAPEILHPFSRFTAGDAQEQVVFEHVSGDIVLAFMVERQPREAYFLDPRRDFVQKGIPGECHDRDTRCHDIARPQRIESNQVLEHPRFLFGKNSFRVSQVGLCQQLFAAERDRAFPAADHAGKHTREHHERVHRKHHHLKRPRGETGESTPVACAQCFGYDFGEHENQERKDCRCCRHVDIAEQPLRLCTHARRAHRVGDCVETQNRRQGPVDVVFEPLEYFAWNGMPLAEHGNVGRSHAEKDRFHDRAVKGNADGQQEIGQQQIHIVCSSGANAQSASPPPRSGEVAKYMRKQRVVGRDQGEAGPTSDLFSFAGFETGFFLRLPCKKASLPESLGSGNARHRPERMRTTLLTDRADGTSSADNTPVQL